MDPDILLEVTKFTQLMQQHQDELAEGRDALMTARSKDEKAVGHNNFEWGLIVAGMHVEAAVIARNLKIAFGQ